MGGGGGHGDFYYPKEVWTPTGGWWCDPKHWRRNTALALTGIALICIPIAMKSVSIEQRAVAPKAWIPSQMWSKNIPKADEE